MTPFIVLSSPVEQCATFVWDDLPGVFLGYRFLEGQPAVAPARDYSRQPRRRTSPAAFPDRATLIARGANWRESWLSNYEEQDPAARVQLGFRAGADGRASAVVQESSAPLRQEFLFEPASDGVWLLLKATALEPLPAGYLLQQCLRFTGAMNEAWRREIAHTPFFSELDMQAMGPANRTLTFARRAGSWYQFPVPYTRLETRLDNAAGERIDHGLIGRETPSRDEAPGWYFDRVAPGATWQRLAAGLYWERTAAVSNRHPADCVHAWVDVGPLAAGETRLVHGKVYFFEGGREDLLAHWRSDFSA